MIQETGERSRRRRGRRWRPPPGSAPGTLVADPTAPKPEITIFAFGPDRCEEATTKDLSEITESRRSMPVTWVNVDGLGDVNILQRLGEIFDLHRLALEDVINVHQRPKVEEYEDHHFIVARMPLAGERLETEQISMFLGKGFLVTFQERRGDCFDSVRARIRQGKGRIRRSGADYLAYALLDSVVDSYFPIMEGYGERLEEIEDEVLDEPEADTLPRIHAIKRDLLTLRRLIWPQREAVNTLIRGEAQTISDETRVHLRDCYDHAVQLMELVEGYRELSSGLMDLSLSLASNRMNEVMKVLTVIATIFIPLTFIAGIYGMNFNTEASPWNLPELGWYWGYPICLAVMGAVAVALLFFFHRKRWL